MIDNHTLLINAKDAVNFAFDNKDLISLIALRKYVALFDSPKQYRTVLETCN